MNRQTAIAKLQELASKTELTEQVEGPSDTRVDEVSEMPLMQRIEAVRKHVEDLSSSFGVELKPDSLAVPVPVELLTEIINRICILESVVPSPVEFIIPSPEL